MASERRRKNVSRITQQRYRLAEQHHSDECKMLRLRLNNPNCQQREKKRQPKTMVLLGANSIHFSDRFGTKYPGMACPCQNSIGIGKIPEHARNFVKRSVRVHGLEIAVASRIPHRRWFYDSGPFWAMGHAIPGLESIQLSQRNEKWMSLP